jgi:hypothetical protein
MSFSGWDKHPNGDLVVYPVVGWNTATAMKGMAGVVRLEYSTDPSMKQQAAAQLILTMPQVRELSGTLAKLADTLESQLAADKPVGPRN